MVAARRRSASSGPLRGVQRHVRRRARACVQSNLPAMPTIGEGGLIPPISGQSPSQAGKPLVYLDYLEVAPWNRPDFGPVPRLRGVGSALITAAVALSDEEGFKGRLGLHSLPQADAFYRKIGMTDLGPDPAYQNLRYFEMTVEQARTFLEGEQDR